MLKYIIKRILWIIPILIGVTIVVFTILYFSPGDPAYLALGDNATPEAVEAYRIEMGINGTYWERLGRTLLGLFSIRPCQNIGMEIPNKAHPVHRESRMVFCFRAATIPKNIPSIMPRTMLHAEILNVTVWWIP